MGEATGRPPPRLGGRFIIVDELGDGGTATVFLAWDSFERSWCAVKALQFRHLRDEEIRRRFDQEADALDAIRHPNIPRLVAYDPDAAPPYLAMELARCGSAMDWVRAHGPMPPSLAADVMFQVCEALTAVHALGIVHRDVKPHNFLLDDKGVCKLTDFGIARVTENTSLTITGSQIGTFSFMAPEQRTDTKSVDWRADVYSVGASLFTLLTGKVTAELFVGEKDEDMLADVHAVFRPLILKSTRYKPEERHASITEFQTELMDALARLSPSMAEVPPLVVPPPPLPVGPPKVLPPGKRFDDLERSLALDANQPTFLPAQDRDALVSPKRVLPYTMPRPRRTPDSAEGREIPDYVDPDERRALSLPPVVIHEELTAGTGASSAPTSLASPPAPTDDGRWIRWVALSIGLGAFSVGLVFAAVVVGAVQVGGARRDAYEAGLALASVVEADGAVVYDLRGDRSAFETIYQDFDSARDPDARITAALAFVDAVDAAVDAGVALPSSEGRVHRLQAAAERYRSAELGWQGRTASFPGSWAVTLRFASAPADD